jgi:uncharacterized protein (TIGR02611 family)
MSSEKPGATANHAHHYVEKLRHWLRLDKLPPLARKIVVFAVGGVLLVAGVVMIVAPGPAFVFIPLALLLLATEFHWAERATEKLFQAVDWFKTKWKQRKKRNAT